MNQSNSTSIMRAMSIAYQIELPDDLASRLEVMAKDMGLSLGAVFKGAGVRQNTGKDTFRNIGIHQVEISEHVNEVVD